MLAALRSLRFTACQSFVHAARMLRMHGRFKNLVLVSGLLAGCVFAEDDPFKEAGNEPPAPADLDELAALAKAPLGATLDPGGATFSVWAPSAKSVSLQGDFSSTALPMMRLTPRESGVFSVRVPAAKAGQLRIEPLLDARVHV